MPTRVDVKSEAVQSLAKSNQVRADLQRRADKVANAARARSEDPRRIKSTSIIGRARAHASVINVGGLSEEGRDRLLGIAITTAVEVGVNVVAGTVLGPRAGRTLGGIAGGAAGEAFAARRRR